LNVVALTTDLMDRSKLTSAIPGLSFTLTADADVVIVDLARAPDIVAIRAGAPNASIVAYGPHVEDFSEVDADVVLPRSKFFRDPGAVVTSLRA
jgi:hypothetical protein